MEPVESALLDLSALAVSAGPPPDRAAGLLERLHRFVPFDSAWIAYTDVLRGSYGTLSSRDLDQRTESYLAGPAMARDIDATGTNRIRSPLSPSDLPYPVQELETWAECLLPAGYHEALAVALYSSDRRHVGFMALLFEDSSPPLPDARRLVATVSTLLADAVDPMRSLLPAARLVPGARAGVVLRADGATQELTGLGGHELLEPGSPVMRLAQQALMARQLCTAFLWPLGGGHPSRGHAQITVLAAADVPAMLTGMVLVSSPRDLRGLTPRELQILGLLIVGQSNVEIAHTLTVAPRTVAAHVEHILHKLDVSTRTLAAVRAEREGLYVPFVPAPGRCPVN